MNPFYFANPCGPAARQAMADGLIGWIDTPNQGNIRPHGTRWCADNGCFNDANFDIGRWWRWLQKHDDIEHCVFATAPDVVGDAAATLTRSAPWLPRIRSLGYPAAFVAQDGADQHPPPWDDFDVLFIGGTDHFKLGPVAQQLIAEARDRGLWVHVGRVNSYRRFRAMEALGCNSVDGTYLRFAPDANLARLVGWVAALDAQPGMFTIGERP